MMLSFHWKKTAGIAVSGLGLLTSLAYGFPTVDFLSEIPNEKQRVHDFQGAYRFSYFSPTQDEANLTLRNFSISRQSVSAKMMATQSNRTRLALVPKFRYANIKTDALIPGTATPVPFELYDVGLRMNLHMRTSLNGVFGVSFEPSSISDKPFKSGSWAFDTTVFYRPGAQRGRSLGRWIYYVDFSTNRLIFNNLPIPGFGFDWDISPNVSILIGAPALSMDARITPRLNYRFRFFPAQEFRSDLSYTLTETEWIAIQAEWDFEGYRRLARTHSADRVTLIEKRLNLFIGARVIPEFTVWGIGGVAFHRSIFEGKDWNDTARGEIKIQPTVIGSVGFTLNL